MRAMRAVARADYVRMEEGTSSDASSEDYEPPVHPEFLGARISDVVSAAVAVRATAADALRDAWPHSGPLTAPLLIAPPPAEAAAGDGAASMLHPDVPPSFGLNSLAELLGWDAQVQVSSAAGQQANATLRSWQQYAEAQAAAAQAAARSAAAPPVQPRPLKRLRKVADAAPGGNDDAEADAGGAGSEATPAAAPPSPAAHLLPSGAAAAQAVAEAAALHQGADAAGAGSASADAQRQAAARDAGGGLQLPQGVPLAATAQVAPQATGWSPPPAVLADSAVPADPDVGPHVSLQPGMSAVLAAAGAACNFQLDAFGAATWVHQASGRRLLLAAPPSGANLAAFAAWRRLRGPDGAAPLLADKLQELHALTLRPGQTAYLPGGWLQAQLAVTDGSAVAGRWLQRGALGPQIAAWKLAADAPEEQMTAFRGFLWRVAVAAARHLQGKAHLSQDGLAAKLTELETQRADAEAKRAARAAAAAERRQAAASARAAKAATAAPPTPAVLAAGLGDDDDWDAPPQPEAAAEEAPEQPAPPSLRRTHRRKAAKPQAADGGGGGGSVQPAASNRAQLRISVKLGASSGDLTALRGAAAAPSSAAATARAPAGRVTTKSGRSAGRAYTRGDADESEDDSDAEPPGARAAKKTARLRIRLPTAAFPGEGQVRTKSGRVAGRPLTWADKAPLSDSSSGGDGAPAAAAPPRIRLRYGSATIPQVDGAADGTDSDADAAPDAPAAADPTAAQPPAAEAAAAQPVGTAPPAADAVDVNGSPAGAADAQDIAALERTRQLQTAAAAMQALPADADAQQAAHEPAATAGTAGPANAAQEPTAAAGAAGVSPAQPQGDRTAAPKRQAAACTTAADTAAQPAEIVGQPSSPVGMGLPDGSAAAKPSVPAVVPEDSPANPAAGSCAGQAAAATAAVAAAAATSNEQQQPQTPQPQKGSLMRQKAAQSIEIVATGKKAGQTPRPKLRHGLAGTAASAAATLSLQQPAAVKLEAMSRQPDATAAKPEGAAALRSGRDPAPGVAPLANLPAADGRTAVPAAARGAEQHSAGPSASAAAPAGPLETKPAAASAGLSPCAASPTVQGAPAAAAAGEDVVPLPPPAAAAPAAAPALEAPGPAEPDPGAAGMDMAAASQQPQASPSAGVVAAPSEESRQGPVATAAAAAASPAAGVSSRGAEDAAGAAADAAAARPAATPELPMPAGGRVLPPPAAAELAQGQRADRMPCGDVAYERDAEGLAALLQTLRGLLPAAGAAASVPAFISDPQRLLDELEVSMAAAGVGIAAAAVPLASRRSAAVRRPAVNGAAAARASDSEDYQPAGKLEADSSSDGGSGGDDEKEERGAFAPRSRPDGTPAGLKRRARSGPLSPEGAEEAGDSVAEARSRGGRGLKPGQHAGLPMRAGAPALGRGLSIKGRLMKKLRLG